jgi:hypothetical protein
MGAYMKLFQVDTRRMFQGDPLHSTRWLSSLESVKGYVNECRRKGIEVLKITRWCCSIEVDPETFQDIPF